MTHNEESHRGCVIVVVAPAEFARERKNHHQHNIMAVTDMVIEDWYPTSAYFSLVPEMLFTQLLQNSSRVEHQKIQWLLSVQSFAFQDKQFALRAYRQNNYAHSKSEIFQ